jgi:hypothetical protein
VESNKSETMKKNKTRRMIDSILVLIHNGYIVGDSEQQSRSCKGRKKWFTNNR